jgi:SAM-dependent methyltransferase
VSDARSERTGFSDVDSSATPAYFIQYLDGARKAPAIIQAKEWSFEHLHLTDGQRVLDVGCGTGEDVVAIASIIGPEGRAIGVDSSTEMTSEAQKRHGPVPGVSFLVGDAQRLPFASGTFDSCRTERTLLHLADPDRAVFEMTRVLKRGGWIALVEPETLVIEGADAALSTRLLSAHIEQHLQPRIGRRLRGLLTTNGFDDVTLAAWVVMHTDLETSRRAFGIFRAVITAVSARLISQEEADRWLADLQRANEEGRFFCTVTGFRAAGRKRQLKQRPLTAGLTGVPPVDSSVPRRPLADRPTGAWSDLNRLQE